MGGTYSMHVGDEKCIQNFVGNPEGRYHLEDLGIDRSVMLKLILWKMGFGGVDWIHLAQDKDWWCALVNTVMNLWVP
jgi:hypothetical protein